MEKGKEIRQRSITLTKEMDEAIFRMRQDEKYSRMSISDIIRILIQAGLNSVNSDSRPA